MSKKTPKNSKKRSRKAKERKEKLIIAGISLMFIALIGVLAFIFYFSEAPSFSKDAAAVVNREKITIEELDWWYKTSVLPEYRSIVTKQDFLTMSLIPQEILLQKAKEQNIKATKDEVEKLLGLFIIENGLTLNEFEKQLDSRGITLNEIKKSFEIRAVIAKLLEKENIYFYEEGKEPLFDENGSDFQKYLDSLINNSDIRIFPENINKLVLRNFEATGDKLCDEEKPVVRLYTTSKCGICNESSNVFKSIVDGLVESGKIRAFHWSLDTGDNLLTAKMENGIPKEELELFKRYSPGKLVPAIAAACKYKHVGKFGAEEGDELKDILKTLTSS